MFHRLRQAAFGLLLAAPLAAQPGPINSVCVTGVIQPTGGPSICLDNATHRLECTQVRLFSNVVDLDAFVGQLVEIVGVQVSFSCPTIHVVQINLPNAVLESCGTASTCCNLKVKVCPGGLGQGAIFLAFQPGFFPFGCGDFSPFPFIRGSWLLGGDVVQVWSGTIAAGCGEVTLSIPCANDLVGLELFFQGARQDIGPVGPVVLTNALCFQIAPFLPPCAPTNC